MFGIKIDYPKKGRSFQLLKKEKKGRKQYVFIYFFLIFDVADSESQVRRGQRGGLPPGWPWPYLYKRQRAATRISKNNSKNIEGRVLSDLLWEEHACI